MYCKKVKETDYVGDVELTNSMGEKVVVRCKNHFHYHLYKMIKNGYSPIIAICGEQGIGKSSFALKVCYDYCKIIYGVEFDFLRYSFYNTSDVIERIGNLKKMPLLIDEAGELVDYLEWYKKNAKAIRSMINTQRFRGLLYVFISPFLIEIVKNVRNHFHFKAYVKQRGTVIIWKYKKRFYAEKQQDATYPIILNKLSFKKTDLPQGYYERYKEFSEGEKEKIRLSRQNNLMEDANPIIKRLYNEIRRGINA